MPPWPFRKMKFTISGFPAAAYLSLKTIWSNICRQWNCFKAFCWYLGYTFPHNHSDQTWSQSCWKALLPFLREPEVDIPTKVFNYLYEFGLRPIRPFIICKFLENRLSAHIWATLALRLQVGHHAANLLPKARRIGSRQGSAGESAWQYIYNTYTHMYTHIMVIWFRGLGLLCKQCINIEGSRHSPQPGHCLTYIYIWNIKG